MMAQLKKGDYILVPKLEIADTFWKRAKGLLGTQSLAEDQGLWIEKCNSIHTFFMAYPIDCVFLDREFFVQAVFKSVVPFRMTLPVWSASNVVELRAGTAEKIGIKVGDQLHVGN